MQPTSESLYLGRRRILQVTAAAAVAASLRAARPGLYPAKRNDRYRLDRPLSDETVVGRNNIFDEFSMNRQEIWKIAANFATAPWAVHVGGAVKKQKKIDVEDLARLLGVEERLYRHRCVEAWAMAVPWTGIPLAKFVAWASRDLGSRYGEMAALMLFAIFVASSLGWPYVVAAVLGGVAISHLYVNVLQLWVGVALLGPLLAGALTFVVRTGSGI